MYSPSVTANVASAAALLTQIQGLAVRYGYYLDNPLVKLKTNGNFENIPGNRFERYAYGLMNKLLNITPPPSSRPQHAFAADNGIMALNFNLVGECFMTLVSRSSNKDPLELKHPRHNSSGFIKSLGASLRRREEVRLTGLQSYHNDWKHYAIDVQNAATRLSFYCYNDDQEILSLELSDPLRATWIRRLFRIPRTIPDDFSRTDKIILTASPQLLEGWRNEIAKLAVKERLKLEEALYEAALELDAMVRGLSQLVGLLRDSDNWIAEVMTAGGTKTRP